MPYFKGFSTIDRVKKFTLTDTELVKRDLLNAFTIKAGQMPGRPDVGSSIWGYIFEPEDSFTREKIVVEVKRIIAMDSRLALHEVQVAFEENTVRVYVSLSIQPNVSTEQFYLNFVKDTKQLTIS